MAITKVPPFFGVVAADNEPFAVNGTAVAPTVIATAIPVRRRRPVLRVVIDFPLDDAQR